MSSKFIPSHYKSNVGKMFNFVSCQFNVLYVLIKISPIQDLLNILYVLLMSIRPAFHAAICKYVPKLFDEIVMFNCNFCKTWVMLGRAISTAFK